MFLEAAKSEDLVRRALVRHVPFGGQMLEHGLLSVGLPQNTKVGIGQTCCSSNAYMQIKDLGSVREGALLLMNALNIADEVSKQVNAGQSKGYITYTKSTRPDGTEVENYEVSSYSHHLLLHSTHIIGVQPNLLCAVQS